MQYTAVTFLIHFIKIILCFNDSSLFSLSISITTRSHSQLTLFSSFYLKEIKNNIFHTTSCTRDVHKSKYQIKLREKSQSF